MSEAKPVYDHHKLLLSHLNRKTSDLYFSLFKPNI